MNASEEFGSPPTYNATRFPLSGEKKRNGYAEVPSHNTLDMSGADGVDVEQPVGKARYELENGLFGGIQDKVNAEDLCKCHTFSRHASHTLTTTRLSDRFIGTHKRPIPPFSIRITGYYQKARDSTVRDHDDTLVAFSFSMLLPKLEKRQRAFFARAHDSPCLRGGRPAPDGFRAKQCTPHSTPINWPSVCDDDEMECWDSENGGSYPASKDQKRRWDARRRQILFPPWLPLSKAVHNEHIEEDRTDSGAIDASLIKRTLSTYLHSPKHMWSRRLICPQMLYGWDANLITSELQKLLSQRCKSQPSRILCR